MQSRNLENVRIRLLIMLIAVLGGIGFLGYLSFTILAANENERRIADLHHVKFPVIEELLRLKRDVGNVHESFSAALALENYFLLEDTYEAARNFSDRVGLINELEPATESFTHSIQSSFVTYYDSAKAIAKILIEQPDKSDEYAGQMEEVNHKLANLNAQLISAIQVRKQEYQSLLEQTDSEMKRANSIGVVLGVLLILGLVMLAWGVSVSVVRAVNRSNQLKEIFLATMSHELRTPINGISGAMRLLKQTELDDDQAKLLEACRTSEIAITTTVDDILEFSSMMSGKLNLTAKPFCVYSILVNTIDLFAAECRSKELEVELESDIGEDMIVAGDEQKLAHALRHLIGNAVKFSTQGTIKVELRLKKSKEPDKELFRIIIHDNGPGISENFIDMAFEPFRQIDGSFSRQHQGVGIGLPICRNIAKAMGGNVWLRNREEGGLTASLSFYAGVTTFRGQMEKKQELPVKGANENDLSMLIVEDNKVNQLVLKGHLKKMGYQADVAENGLEAVEKIESTRYSIVFMDCQMPIMDGFEATQQIRSQLAGKYKLPIIAVTANAMDGDKEKCLEAGMDDYIKKPVDVDVLKSMIEKYLADSNLW